jgi:shikimate dehydrogenase
MTKYVGLIGYPLKHSISPDFQQAALDYYGLDIRYTIWEAKVEEVFSTINQLRQPQNLGANVTVPYKEEILSLLDEVDKQASLIGAVNVVTNQDGRLVGFNTDAYGFIQALRKDAEFEPRDKRVVLLGAGGVARAACFALVQENVATLVITNRTLKRAESLIESLIGYAMGEKRDMRIIALPWNSLELQEEIRGCQLIVNCTTLGMRHSAQERKTSLEVGSIPSSALVYDLVYNPSETPLMKMAIKAGARTLGGLPMLVYQGAAAFELWVGKEAPVDIMFSAAKAALDRYK